MANSYIAVPNVLPGNVTVGGNLTVAGNEITIGSFTRKMRIGVFSNNFGRISWNQLLGGTSRDDASAVAQSLFFGAGVSPLGMEYENTAGNVHDTSPCNTLLTDYTLHTNTGNTTENTIYSKTLRAGLLGANGGFIVRMMMLPTVQGATSTTVRLKLGGTIIDSAIIVTGDAGNKLWWEWAFYKRNSNTNSFWSRLILGQAAGLTLQSNVIVFDTSVDRLFEITIQNGANTDSINLDSFTMMQVNTYGPVS